MTPTRFTAAQLQSMSFPPQRFAVPDLIPEGLTVLAGAPKLGKSWLALQMALSITEGSPFLGSINVERGPALVLALEDGPRRLRDRVSILVGSSHGWPADLHVWTDRPTRLLDDLAEHLDTHPETRLVVVDTLTKVRPPTPPGGPTYVDDYKVAGHLQRFALDRRVALVVVHHTRKGRSEDFVEGVSGTHGITGAADAIVLLDRNRAADGGLLHVTGRDLRDDLAWQLERVGPAWHLVERVRADVAHATDGLGDASSRIVDAVAHSDDPLSAADVARITGLPTERVKDYLARLARDGRLHRPARGRYALPLRDPVASVASVAIGEGDTRDACDTPLGELRVLPGIDP